MKDKNLNRYVTPLSTTLKYMPEGVLCLSDPAGEEPASGLGADNLTYKEFEW